jgi:large subunit ribosomal protein L33
MELCAKIRKLKWRIDNMRDNITLVCTECKEENYITTKNKKLHSERVEVKKFCSRCNKKTAHKEKK